MIVKIGFSGHESSGRRRRASLPTFATVSLVLFFSAVAGSQPVHAQPTSPTFVWYFGYVGNTFYPQSQLGVSPQALISEASSISAAVGPSNLRLVSAIDEIQGRHVSQAMMPTEKAYVDSLRRYASVVYGRIDMQHFNMTSSPTIYAKVAEYASQLDLNGVWFDHAIVYYNVVGQAQFNSMMQTLSSTNPSFQFILNNAATNQGYITPLPGDTWAANTYICPSVKTGTFNTVNLAQVATFNSLYPNRVLIHWDAYAQSSPEPMGLFANQPASTEISAVRTLAHQGVYPSVSSQRYLLLYPVIGAWTSAVSTYQGTLYNSLSIGTYSRGTAASMVSVMVNP